MSRIRKELSRVSTLLPLKGIIKMSKQNVFLPFYHTVIGDNRLPHIENLYKPLSLVEFEDHLEEILKFFKPISMSELMGADRNNEPIQQPVFHLSFDDGLSGIYDLIAPVLLKKGIPATFFLNSDFIDNEGLFYRYKVSLIIDFLKRENIKMGDSKERSDYSAKKLLSLSLSDEHELDTFADHLGISFTEFLQESKPYLTENQINSLINDGFTIGAHSKNHPEYFRIPMSEQLLQTRESISEIGSRFNLDYRVFSFPFTDDGVSKTFFNEIKGDLDLSFSSSGIKKDNFPFHLHRTPMETFSPSAKKIISSEYLYYLLKSGVGKNMAHHP